MQFHNTLIVPGPSIRADISQALSLLASMQSRNRREHTDLYFRSTTLFHFVFFSIVSISRTFLKFR